MTVRALRGAITVDHDDKAEILTRTTDLLTQLFERNQLDHEAVISIFFTATTDLRSVPPAVAARSLGLIDVPLLCAQEMDVDGTLERCIRMLVHADITAERSDLRHVFLRGATVLRPELAEPGDEAR